MARRTSKQSRNGSFIGRHILFFDHHSVGVVYVFLELRQSLPLAEGSWDARQTPDVPAGIVPILENEGLWHLCVCSRFSRHTNYTPVSIANSRRFIASPCGAEKPPKRPPAASTRWAK